MGLGLNFAEDKIMKRVDVLVIGAGPSGATASALCNKKGLNVLCVDKDKFPRFVIGESLLPACMGILEEAGFLEAVEEHKFQYKNGAAFTWGDKYTYFDFTDKFTDGYGTTYQVQRGEFDKILINEAKKQGVEVRFNTEVEDVEFKKECAVVHIKDKNGTSKVKAKFVLDASGYGRVLPRLLNLETPSCLPKRVAYFTHVEDKISHPFYDRKKILITTHPEKRGVWFWLIPFSNGRASLGVVGLEDELKIKGVKADENKKILQQFVKEAGYLGEFLKDASWDMDVRKLEGYSKNVTKLYGDKYALLGNASEFLDPVFSSGVTLALYSAKLASKVVTKMIKGKKYDWKEGYEKPLMLAVDTFRVYVQGWYETSFQDVIYSKKSDENIERMISSILAGYAWDEKNPYVTKPEARLRTLAAICKS